MYHNNSNSLESAFVKLSEKSSIFYHGIYCCLATIRVELQFCHSDGQKIEEIVSLLIRYGNVSSTIAYQPLSFNEIN